MLAPFLLLELGVRLAMSPNASFPERLTTSLAYEPSGLVRFLPMPPQELLESERGRPVAGRVRYRIDQHGFRGEDFPLERQAIQYRMVEVESHAQLVEPYETCGRILREVAEEERLLLLDLGHDVRDLAHFVDHVHTTPEGSRALAERYHRALEAHLTSFGARDEVARRAQETAPREPRKRQLRALGLPPGRQP